MEEVEEFCDVQIKEEVVFEVVDLVYFVLIRCVSKGVSWRDVEVVLDKKVLKVIRRKGDVKFKWEGKIKEVVNENGEVKIIVFELIKFFEFEFENVFIKM